MQSLSAAGWTPPPGAAGWTPSPDAVSQSEAPKIASSPSQRESQQPAASGGGDPNHKPYKLRSKLRESCNSCAESKVKCTKEQPICSRCEDRDLDCQYSLSRRVGKRKAVSAILLPHAADISSARTRQFRQDDVCLEQSNSLHSSAKNISNNDAMMDLDNDIDFTAHDDGFINLLSTPATDAKDRWKQSISTSSFSAFQTQKSEFSKWENMGFLESGEFPTNGPDLRAWYTAGHEDISIIDHAGTFPYDDQMLFVPILPAPSEAPSRPTMGLPTYSKEPSTSCVSSTTGVPGVKRLCRASADVGSAGLHCMARLSSILTSLHDSPIACSSASMKTSPSCTPGIDTPSLHMFVLEKGYSRAKTPSELSSLATDISTPPLPSSAQTSPAKGLSMEQVLSMNKGVIEALREMLHCACSTDLQVALVFTSITSTVLDRYVATIQPEDDDADHSHSMAQDISDGRNHAKTATHTHIKIRIQHVLGEMHQVLQLIEGLAAKFEWMQSADCGDADMKSYLGACVAAKEGSSDESEDVSGTTEGNTSSTASAAPHIDTAPVFAELQKYLRSQLRMLTTTATTILRRSD
ncbi:hypothetical protein JDV02_010041 [Purpureocillium takamizusanense]|uniref:Zn(2)-C6 fungal-type domain-containing protein n=1 Tax=Purpureocillium takamizusanense TaxID=2060973 RepID=A0A9Q8QQ07_9HYPO|nr:uncharacterized protein JDV02_010041 [Purpureocillium takamizusanense]UNI24283.1 hypothetical protein JDV02_010041 [Purpureocillium takamizusanense]